MRRAYYEAGWMLADDGTLLGLNLGYDRCGEHEQGINDLLSELGVKLPKFPLGVDDRMTTVVPERLQLLEYKTKPRDKRRKGYATAMLCLLEAWEFNNKRTVEETVSAHELVFSSEPGEKWHKPEYDLTTSWNRRGFAIQVRGEENIQRLKDLHAAFLRKDIAVALPWAKSFFRGGTSFVIASRMAAKDKASVLAQDEAYKELILAAEATGVYATLEAAGKGWHALSPAWFDDQKDEVVFFLNPKEQRRYTHGWFTVAELLDWAQDKGPVILEPKLEEFGKHPDNYDWSCRLLRGMNRAGIKPRHHEKWVWMDEAKTIPGLRHRATRDTEHLLPSGDYRFDELMAKYADPLPEAAATA
jgi:hypothetical protein